MSVLAVPLPPYPGAISSTKAHMWEVQDISNLCSMQPSLGPLPPEVPPEVAQGKTAPRALLVTSPRSGTTPAKQKTNKRES